MISQWWITGDTHGDFSRFYKLNNAVPENETWGVIILGDTGVNFWLTKRDKKLKYRICDQYPNLHFYLVRGNHEARPGDINDMEVVWDDEVQNEVYWQPQYPNIKYLVDGYSYDFHGNKTLVVGGAYSVDKYWRLEKQAAGFYGGWFANEQLSQEERDLIMGKCRGGSWDLVLAHTCPWEWEPRDLFLSCVDQNHVDDSMERWLSELLQAIQWKVFLCGHFHDDRILAPHAQMLNTGIQNLEDIMEYWKDETRSEIESNT